MADTKDQIAEKKSKGIEPLANTTWARGNTNLHIPFYWVRVQDSDETLRYLFSLAPNQTSQRYTDIAATDKWCYATDEEFLKNGRCVTKRDITVGGNNPVPPA